MNPEVGHPLLFRFASGTPLTFGHEPLKSFAPINDAAPELQISRANALQPPGFKGLFLESEIFGGFLGGINLFQRVHYGRPYFGPRHPREHDALL